MNPDEFSLRRNIITSRSTNRMIAPNYIGSSSSNLDQYNDISEKRLVWKHGVKPSITRANIVGNIFSSILRSFHGFFTIPSFIPTLTWFSKMPLNSLALPSSGPKFTGTLFGRKRGYISFVIQENPQSEPILLLELAISTCTLVKEMSSSNGLVRIALECERVSKSRGQQRVKLFKEPLWTMYCNGKKYGNAVSKGCGESDWYMLSTIRNVSVGSGVIPIEKRSIGDALEGDELMYMRARFERVVGSKDSVAFYMLNPDGGNGGPDLSVFLLRI
ncbi:hypothetical protein GIB67_040034 [Kingdonia uniflora]|uniref:Protein MIZU-KUSSEI 1-like n=1 Tax=Kingdonia uniflora TaxID=39325 RepID=A0A7J7MUR2_9MAGN|nr:hypothetical protein GIB67_040034 [Kingdonia uniflora]